MFSPCAHLSAGVAGSIAEWKVKVGDFVPAFSVLCSITTDKAVVDFESQEVL